MNAEEILRTAEILHQIAGLKSVQVADRCLEVARENAAASKREVVAVLTEIEVRLRKGSTLEQVETALLGPPPRRADHVKRLAFDFTPEALEGLEELVRDLGAPNRADVVRQALRGLHLKVKGAAGNEIQQARLFLTSKNRNSIVLARDWIESLLLFGFDAFEALIKIGEALRPAWEPGGAPPREVGAGIVLLVRKLRDRFNDRSLVLSRVQVPELRRAAEEALGQEKAAALLREIFDEAAADLAARTPSTAGGYDMNLVAGLCGFLDRERLDRAYMLAEDLAIRPHRTEENVLEDVLARLRAGETFEAIEADLRRPQ